MGEKKGQSEGRLHFICCLTRPIEIEGGLYLAADEAIFGVCHIGCQFGTQRMLAEVEHQQAGD